MVIVNEDEYYQAWPIDLEPPRDCHDIGVRASEAECDRIANDLNEERRWRKR